MVAGLEKHLTQLGWDFVVTTSVQHLGGQTWYFCIKCFGDIFCVIFFVCLQKFCKRYGPLIGLRKN
jgi:hypothetical protein